MNSLTKATIPEVREVLEGDYKFNSSLWPLNFPYVEELKKFKSGGLNRKEVFSSFHQSTRKGVAFAYAWGYPKGTVSHYRNSTPDFMVHLDDFSRALDRLQENEWPARQVIACLNVIQNGISTSTTSKFAYFSQIRSESGLCLIMDRFVRAAFSNYEELHALRDNAEPNNYERFVKTINQLAHKLSCRPDQLEHLLFNDRRKGR